MAHGVLNIMAENYEALVPIFKGMGVLAEVNFKENWPRKFLPRNANFIFETVTFKVLKQVQTTLHNS